MTVRAVAGAGTSIDPWANATATARAVAAGDVTAAAVVEAALAAIAADNPRLGAFTEVTAERARARAEALDAARAAGRPSGPLAGVPFAVKNLFDIAGLPTLAGSRINRDRPPASADATLIVRLERAGAVLVGALNMGEYAYDFTGENSHYGASRNPHDPARMTGGSSGGAAGAVAGGMVPLALGSDTNGSIRVPASFCGIFGLKPTYGRLSRAGTFPFVASLDHVGPMARSTADLVLAYDAMTGYDPADPVSQDRAAESAAAALGHGAEGLRVAVLGGHFQRGAAAEALAALHACAAALHARGEVELPQAARARAAAYVITASEGAALHLHRLRTRADAFDPAVRDRLLAGALIPAAFVAQAQKFRRWYRDQVLRVFAQVDVLLAPATPCSAPLLGQQTFMLDGEELPVRPHLGIYTQPISFIGLPVVAVPVVRPDAMPIGVQVIAAPWCETHALRIAQALERAGVARAAGPSQAV
jgi:aspartyl-tRNA(Asn)/glutamyl-tRNA(Gln) amidotransferase subunit A